jgi:hypothetical protein
MSLLQIIELLNYEFQNKMQHEKMQSRLPKIIDFSSSNHSGH